MIARLRAAMRWQHESPWPLDKFPRWKIEVKASARRFKRERRKAAKLEARVVARRENRARRRQAKREARLAEATQC